MDGSPSLQSFDAWRIFPVGSEEGFSRNNDDDDSFAATPFAFGFLKICGRKELTSSHAAADEIRSIALPSVSSSYSVPMILPIKAVVRSPRMG